VPDDTADIADRSRGNGGTKRSFFRIVKTFPPDNDDYLTPREKGRKPKPGWSDAEIRSLDALSSWDPEAGARLIGKAFPKAGSFIARYDIPAGAGVWWEPIGEPGHHDLRGDYEELRRYLSPDFRAEV